MSSSEEDVVPGEDTDFKPSCAVWFGATVVPISSDFSSRYFCILFHAGTLRRAISLGTTLSHCTVPVFGWDVLSHADAQGFSEAFLSSIRSVFKINSD